MAQENKHHLQKMHDAFSCWKLVRDEKGSAVDYILLDANPSFESLIGLQKENIVGDKLTKILPYINTADFDLSSAFREIRLDNQIVKKEYYSYEKDCWYEVTVYSDAPGYLKSVFRDITASKRVNEVLLENEMNLFRGLESISEGIILIDKSGFIRNLNITAKNLIGWAHEEAVGRQFGEIFEVVSSQVSRAVTNMLEESLETDRMGCYYDYTLLRSCKGEKRKAAYSIIPFINSFNNSTGAALIFKDLTDNILVQEAVQESELKYRQLFNESPISLWEVDLSEAKRLINEIKSQGIEDFEKHLQFNPELASKLAALVEVIDVNNATLNLYEAQTKEEYFEKFTEIFNKDMVNGWHSIFLSLAAGKTEFFVEQNHKTFSGKSLEVHFYLSVVPGYEDTYSRVLVSIINITELKQAEEVLKEREKELAVIYENAPLILMVLDKDKKIKKINGQDKLSFLEKDLDEMIGLSIDEAFNCFSTWDKQENTSAESPCDNCFICNIIHDTYETGHGYHQVEVRLHSRVNDEDCEQYFLLSTLRLTFRKQLAVLVSIQDITERKQTERELLYQKAHFESLFTNTNDAIVFFDTDFNIFTVNSQFTRMFGYELEEVKGRDVFSAVSFDRKKLDYVADDILQGEKVEKETVRYNRKGEAVEVYIKGGPVYVYGRITGGYIIYSDITKSKKAERELLNQKAHFESLFTNTNDAMAFFDIEENIFNINYRFVEMFGYELEEVKGKNINKVVDPMGKMSEYASPKIVKGETVEMETVRYNKAGEEMYLLLKGAPVYVDGVLIGGYAIYSDITKRKKVR